MNNFSQYLKKNKVKSIYFCSGARNAPLLEEIKNEPSFKLHICHDERAASFQALGEAKQSQLPTVICTTSGTALAECYPAFVEAYYSKTPLIIVSADRPAALQGSRAPQTIMQDHFFGHYARCFLNNLDHPIVKFPAHLNLSINIENFTTDENQSKYIEPEELSRLDLSVQNTLIVLNDFPDHYFMEKLQQIIQKKFFLTYQEVESLFYKEKFKNEILFDEQIQHLLADNILKNIIAIGKTSNSKFWRNLNTQYPNTNIIEVSKDDSPSVFKSNVLPFRSREFILAKLESSCVEPHFDFKDQHLLEYKISKLCSSFPEAELTKSLQLFSDIDKKGDVLFIGNSSPVRHLKFFKPKYLQIQANRGANGIDGLIATASGVANASPEKQVHLIIGDLSFMYDFSSLFQVKNSNLHIHVLNNQGGRIFENLNIDKRISCSHHRTFLYWDMEFKFNIGSFQEILPCPEQTRLLKQSLSKAFQRKSISYDSQSL